MAQHAKYSASGSTGWSSCAGKLAMEEGIPDSQSNAADEGSAAHHLAAICLSTGTEPVEYADRQILCWTKPGAESGEVTAGQSFLEEGLPEGATLSSMWPVSEDMVYWIETYVLTCKNMIGTGVMFVEKKVSFGGFIGVEGQFGTADCIVIDRPARRLTIGDLKTGRIAVSADNNTQMQLYALGVLETLSDLVIVDDLDTVRLFISQPKLGVKPDVWETTVPDLLAFADTMREAAARSEQAYMDLMLVVSDDDWKQWEDTYLTPTEKGCLWCKAAATAKCSKQISTAMKAMELIGQDLTTMPDLDAEDSGILDLLDEPSTALAKVEESTEDMVAKMLNAVRWMPFNKLVELYKLSDTLESIAEAAKQRMLFEMLNGEEHPDFKLVYGRKPDRRWGVGKEAAVIEILGRKRIKVDQVYNKKLKTPTQLQQALKSVGKLKVYEEVAEFIEIGEAKLTVAPISDKRPAASNTKENSEVFMEEVSLKALVDAKPIVLGDSLDDILSM